MIWKFDRIQEEWLPRQPSCRWTLPGSVSESGWNIIEGAAWRITDRRIKSINFSIINIMASWPGSNIHILQVSQRLTPRHLTNLVIYIIDYYIRVYTSSCLSRRSPSHGKECTKQYTYCSEDPISEKKSQTQPSVGKRERKPPWVINTGPKLTCRNLPPSLQPAMH